MYWFRQHFLIIHKKKKLMELQSKWLVYAAIASLGALMGGFVLYASSENPELEKMEIELQEVSLVEVNSVENMAELEIIFLIKNPSTKTFTVPLINYELFGDGERIGSGQYSTEDIAMPGRAAFYQGVEIPLKTKLVITQNSENAGIYQAIVNGDILDFSAKGVITVETSWSLIEKDFEI
jgi:hypothetical protein